VSLKPLLVTSGEPAGIGPDLCLDLAGHATPLVVVCDKTLLSARAKQLGKVVKLIDYQPSMPFINGHHELQVIHTPCLDEVIAGALNVKNAHYVMSLLSFGVHQCLQGAFSALVTAPVNKAIINQAGIAFSGHTEFFAEQCKASQVVMMLTCPAMKVALVTTHLPLRQVPDAITGPLITEVISQLHRSLQRDFGIIHPRIFVAGLNPHAGESGYLGREEIDTIEPVLNQLRADGMDVQGPFPADTLFSQGNAERCDAFVAMYHDQGLTVLKYAGFGQAVNVTLGLPIIRTSVDHGTALELAGSGMADSASLKAAVDLAANIGAQHANA
jgi:4-hydroxythreonine-4-phosphate dehydrogenase